MFWSNEYTVWNTVFDLTSSFGLPGGTLWVVRLKTTAPFSFPLTAHVLARLPEHNQLERFDAQHEVHQRALMTANGPRVVTVKPVRNGLELSDDSPEAQTWARLSFGLNLNPTPWHAATRGDAALERACTVLNGLRPPLMDHWEAWVAAILGQQITLQFCLAQIGMVSRRFGGEVSGTLPDGRPYLFPLHPTPEAILEADPDALLACKVSRRKTEYLKTVAQALLDGYFNNMLEAPLPDALDHLVALRGVGLWTARYWLASVGRLDSLAYGDAGLNSAYKRAYGTLDGVEAWGEALGDVRGWAYYYLIWSVKYIHQS